MPHVDASGSGDGKCLSHNVAHCAWTAVLGTNTNVRRPNRLAASKPIIVFPAPGGSTRYERSSPPRTSTSNESNACR